MSVYAQRNKPDGFLSRRAIGFLATAALHVLIVYGLITGLARSVVEVLKGPIETKIIEEVQEKKDEPPPPPPKFDKPPPPFVPPPDISIAADAPPAATAITQATTQRPVAPAAVAAVVPPRSNPRRPVTQPEYPPSSKRAGEEGVVVLQLYVLEDGKVGEAKVEKSSGFPKLDEAALKEALRSWKLLPATQGGKPLAMWYSFRVVFKITD
ncbi:MAG: energy transducer TonB [Rhodospirillaceae bacterium]|nr:energy transducer TonB [Rhodospirillaceae bacterium]